MRQFTGLTFTPWLFPFFLQPIGYGFLPLQFGGKITEEGVSQSQAMEFFCLEPFNPKPEHFLTQKSLSTWNNSFLIYELISQSYVKSSILQWNWSLSVECCSHLSVKVTCLFESLVKNEDLKLNRINTLDPLCSLII